MSAHSVTTELSLPTDILRGYIQVTILGELSSVERTRLINLLADWTAELWSGSRRSTDAVGLLKYGVVKIALPPKTTPERAYAMRDALAARLAEAFSR